MIYYENVLNRKQHEYVIEKTMFGNQWQFIGQSVSSENTLKFWYMDLIEDPFFSDEFLKTIETITGKKFELLRVYANGQTYGLPGQIHKDIDTNYSLELYHTFVYFVNPIWDFNWGGATFLIKPDNTFDTVLPTPNNGFMFNSTLPHVGTEPTRYCPELRVTVAFKLKEII
jgi:hypothetical protein